MSIQNIYKCWFGAPLFVSLLMNSGCNTIETDFYIGNINDVKLTTDPEISQLRLAADGAETEIKVVSNVKWELIPPEHPFSASATSTEGDGTIKVWSTNNINASETPSSELTVRAVDFPEKSFKITLIQQQLLFQMEDKNSADIITSQKGGDVEIMIRSSIDWKLDITENADWIKLNPGAEGKGNWEDITLKVIWTPNYTTSPREISIRLLPSDDQWLGNVKPTEPIVLRQEAGTLPTDIVLTASEADKTSVPLSIQYASEAPVEKVELEVINISSIDQQTNVVTVPNNSGSENYPESGNINFTLDNLEPGTPYILTPIVTSKVGTAKGESKRVQTRGDIIFNYPTLEACNISPEETGVNAFFKTVSEFELTSFKVNLCQADNTVLATQYGKISSVLDQTNTPISWIGELTWDNNVKLQQNTDYYFELTITGNDPNRPDVQNTIQYTLGYEHFTTLFRLPEQDDNHPIN